MNPRELRERTGERIRSAMTLAMRADPVAIAGALESGPDGLAAHDRALLREARRLTLTFTAALTTVLSIHRYGQGPHGGDMCLACGASQCRTVRGVAAVFDAYALRADEIDRAEAWRRAEIWFTRELGRPAPVAVDEFNSGFITRAGSYAGRLVVDRRSGALSQWPELPRDEIIDCYHRYLRGEL